MGIERSEAAKYSFILSIPTILAAVLLDVVDTVQAGEINTDLFPQYAVGFIVSAVVGFLAIKLLQYILNRKTHNFLRILSHSRHHSNGSRILDINR